MKRWRWLALALVFLLGVGIGLGVSLGLPWYRYKKGLSLRAEQKWAEAIEAFAAAGAYRDAPEQILETRYQRAEALRQAGDYDEAYAAFLQISGYRDADAILAGDPNFRAAGEQYEENTAAYRIPGNIVAFGRYEQDGDAEDGTEPIEWIVLEQQEDRALLLSRYGLDARSFHASRALVTWEKSSMRAWLNNDFLGAAFSPGERQAILKTRIDNSPAQSYEKHGASSGSDTQDMVFLLSYAEAWRYFPTDAERVTSATPYAQARGAYTSGINGNCWWWLRSSGSYGTCAANVHYNGMRGDFLVHDPYAAVRPAIWVDLRSGYFSLGK